MINIYTEPNTISTPYRPTFIDCSSDLGTITRMIADVYVNSSLKTTIDKDPILGTTNTFRFEVGDILKKYLFSDFFTISSNVQAVTGLDCANNYHIRAFEVLDNGTTLDTSWTSGGTGTNYEQSTTLYTFNGVNQHEQTLSDYIASTSTSKFLTNRPNQTEVPRNDFRIGILTEEAQAFYTVTLFTGKNATGSTISTTSSATIAPTNKRMSLGVRLANLSSTAKSFTVRAYNTAPAEITELMTFNIVDECDDETIVYWQNHWGEFDNFLFKGEKRQKTKTRTKTIENRLALDYSTSDRGVVDLTKDNEREFTVYTNTQSRNVVKWLSEIGESVDVRISGNIPINVKSVTSTIENTDNGVYQIAVVYTMANKRINQLG